MKYADRKKILIVAGTHGNEPIGLALLKKLTRQSSLKNYKTVIGNPRAVQQNIRFSETDLNRAAPGNEKSKIYEIKRAAQLMKLFKKFDYIIDIHETKANNRIVIILPKLSRESLALALTFKIKTILIWPPSSKKIKSGPLTQYVKSGLEIECGTKQSFALTLEKLTKIITEFLKNQMQITDDDLLLTSKNIEQKNFYLVYDKIKTSEVKGLFLKDLKPIKTKRDKFIPLLFGAHQGLTGYKMKKLNRQILLKIFNLNKKPVI
ncbi:MAG: succinylglutamate desuccinylase/aspartoacylase family protein [Patescibacteria group bacterium]